MLPVFRLSASRAARWGLRATPALALLGFALSLAVAHIPPTASAAQQIVQSRRPLSAAGVPAPPPGEGDIVNHDAAVQLGKALFWDEQVGSDDRMACATCHFAGGVDKRTVNTMDPGPNGRVESQPNTTFSPSSDDAQGSQGVAPCTADPTAAPAEGEERITRDAAGSNARRQVTEYNAPSVINAVLPRDGFWDGRARFRFVDPQSGAVVYSANGALASQAVGPPVNPVEMSCAGRTWEQLANKLLGRKPLGKQQVSGADVVLGGLSDGTSNGLHVSYDALIRSAFGEPQRLPNGSGDDHAKLRANFARIWGQAIQAYETSLVSGQTPFDRFLAGDRRALTPQEDRGYRTFTGKGQCASCHGDNLLGDATVEFFAANGAVNQDGGSQGFHNNGVRPTSDDAGRFEAENLTESERRPQDRGAFKTPVLRNVELTAPYFHTGGFADLRSVVQFYDRRGDFRNREQAGAIRNIRLNANDINDLVAFLGRPLTDPRVASQQAPFDHPSLNPPDGPQLAATGGAAPPTEAPPEDTPRRDPPPGDPPRREPPPRTPPPPPPGPPPPGGGPGGEGSRDRPGRP